jgi:acetylornithine deacetylase
MSLCRTHAESILDVRTTPTINNEAILAKLDALSCDYEIIHNQRRPMACDSNSEVMQAINHALPGQETCAVGGSCDMAFATQPSIVMGVGKSVRSHAADEFVEEDELADGVTKYVKVIESYVKLFG